MRPPYKITLSLALVLFFVLGAFAQSTNLPGQFSLTGSGDTISATALYVAPWGNDSTAVRGDTTKPWKRLYDYDGTNRLGACSVATNGETIVLMGTNYAGHVQLVTGQTLRGYDATAELRFTNGMAFTNNVNAVKGAQNPSWPWIACHGSNIVIKDLILDGRDGSLTTNSANFISLFHSATSPIYNGGNYESLYSDTVNRRVFIFRGTNATLPDYTVWTAFGTTNGPRSVLIDACSLWGNVDVFYLNYATDWTLYNSNCSEAQSTDIGLDCPQPTPANFAAFWQCAGVQAVPWTTNIYTFTKPKFTVRNSTLRSYWDHTFCNGVKFTAINVTAYSLGYVSSNSAANYGNGPVVGGDTLDFSDYGGRYYTTAGAPTNQSCGLTITTGSALLSGTAFYVSNQNVQVFKTSYKTNISGNFYLPLEHYAGYFTNGTTTSGSLPGKF